jgi:pimeloyl-ACP methyl ester carboxylesterase
MMPVINVGDVDLDYERSGSGPPLLLIMGMSGTALHWGEPFLAPLRRDFELIAYDHRGVGASSRLEGSITIAEMAEHAAALLAALEVDSAHVLGISMGGMIAQELALSHPERVRTLALGCTTCGGEGSVGSDPEVWQRLSEAAMSGDRQRQLRTAYEINVSAAFLTDEEAYARFLQISAERSVAAAVVLRQLQACAAHDTNARLGALAMPTLVVHGTEDQLLPVPNAHLIAARIPGSQLEILDGVGHLFFWELPDRSAELVRAHTAVAV